MANPSNVRCEAIVAVSNNQVIGADQSLPWHCPADLKWFKSKTLNRALIMGANTWLSLPNNLPKRQPIVLTRHRRGVVQDKGPCWTAASIGEAVAIAHHLKPDQPPVVIGGASIYDQAEPWIDRWWISRIDTEVTGDTYWSDLNPCRWNETLVSSAAATANSPACRMYSARLMVRNQPNQ